MRRWRFWAACASGCMSLPGRDQNVLSFESQDALAENPAALMREYYRHARVVDRAVRQAIEVVTERPGTLLGRFHEWRARLSTSEFTVSREKVLLRAPQPPEDLSLYEFVARHQLRLAPDTHRAHARDRAQGELGGLEAPAFAASAGGGSAGHAGNGRPGGGAAGVGQHRVPGGARLLPSLHGG